MPKRTPESESVINFLLDKVKKKKLNFLKILDFKRLCTTLICEKKRELSIYSHKSSVVYSKLAFFYPKIL